MYNTISGRYNPNYKIHVLVKYECLDCERSFILSKKQVDDLEGVDVSCPYCGNYNVEDTVIMDDPDSLEELGCMAISHVEPQQNKKEYNPMAIMRKAYIYNPGGGDSRLVVSDKDVINGAEDYDFEEVTLIIKIETMREWAAEQKFIDSQEEDYEILDDRY